MVVPYIISRESETEGHRDRAAVTYLMELPLPLQVQVDTDVNLLDDI